MNISGTPLICKYFSNIRSVALQVSLTLVPVPYVLPSLKKHGIEYYRAFLTNAHSYGDSEELIGKYFKLHPERRNEIFLATKFGGTFDPATGKRGVRSDPAYVRTAVEKSLSRLQLPYIDLYYCHRLDEITPIEETVRAMTALQQEGKIKYLGLSECSAKSLRRASAVGKISAVQIEYSPYALDIENPQIDLLRTARELGVSIIAYSPLGRGMLTGSYSSPDDFEEGDFRKFAPRYSPENFPKNLQLAHDLAAVAKEKGCTPAQLVLKWLMAQGEEVIPIPGTKKLKYLEDNLGAFSVDLPPAEEQKVRKLVEKAEIRGARYPEAMNVALFADTPELVSQLLRNSIMGTGC